MYRDQNVAKLSELLQRNVAPVNNSNKNNDKAEGEGNGRNLSLLRSQRPER